MNYLTTALDELSHQKSDWLDVLWSELHSDWFFDLEEELNNRSASGKNIYPYNYDTFAPLSYTPYNKIKAVIVGQSPYPSHIATGLPFAVPHHTEKLPTSLRNLLKELYRDLRWTSSRTITPSLIDWATGGVLMINSVWTTEKGSHTAHSGLGWEKLTEAIIESVNDIKKPIPFLLLGNEAQSYAPLITAKRHKIMKVTHPSGRSAYKGFFFSSPFSQINQFLKDAGEDIVEWDLIERYHGISLESLKNGRG